MNPFEKRATEFIRDDLAFLPYVTPEPLITYLARYATNDVLYDRLVVLIGAPGSGKTTLARLFLFPTLMTVVRNKTLPPALFDSLASCRAIRADGEEPVVAGCRIPLESDYRDCWELPYREELRHDLFFSLLQARTVLAWLRAIEDAGFALSEVKLIHRSDAEASLAAIGGDSLERIREVAREIERDVYSVTASLLPPDEDQLPPGAKNPYQPFDVIEAFEIPWHDGHLQVRPMVICDDAHVLHPKQLEGAIRWFARREVRVARWILTRMDALRPQDVLKPDEGLVDDKPGFNRSRDMTTIWMQSTDDRAANRRSFRKIAKDMTERYLRQMPVFLRRDLTNLENLLAGNQPSMPAGKLKQLQDSLTTGHRKLIGPSVKLEIESLVDSYLGSDRVKVNVADSPEIRVMMIRILMERYLKRVPQSSLFEETVTTSPSMPLKADSTVRNAAEMLLFQEFDRPFFYGFDTLCDAASENAEKFLRLAGHLVAQLETQIIRGVEPNLKPSVQEKLLRDRASRMLEEEDLPERARVTRLCEFIAAECLKSTQEPNAPLGEGANAWGILQEEFDRIAADQPDLARVLQSGFAHNRFTLVRDHGTKGQIWCLIELSGTWALKQGLSLKRGSFLERKVADLVKAIQSETGRAQ